MTAKPAADAAPTRDELEQRVRELTAALERANQEIRNLSTTDELTGLLNRRGFYALAQKMLQKAKREGAQCVLAFIDVDGLKRVNDQFGHEAGDAMIADVAGVLKRTLRESDVVARLGGNEFCVLAADPVVDGTGMCWRFLTALQEANKSLGRPYRLSASVGYSNTGEVQGEDLDQLILRADGRMAEDRRAKGEARLAS